MPAPRRPPPQSRASRSNQHLLHRPADMNASQASRMTSETLPWEDTTVLHRVSDGLSRLLVPEIQAKIDKGFFKTEDNWTCYRRNYFAVGCSFSLKDQGSDVEPSGPCFVGGRADRPIEAFGMNIAACINGEDTKTVELVQHTPKRDKGPVSTPKPAFLKPTSAVSLGSNLGTSMAGLGNMPSSAGMAAMYRPGEGFYQGHESSHYAASSLPSPPQPHADEAICANFERIQFKKATANNGKRRAQQQYFHVRVELLAGYRRNPASAPSSSDTDAYEWLKIATRLSAQMVVRGRSPGHYQPENSTQSPPGSSGGGVGGAGAGMGGNSGALGGSMGGPMGGYSSGHSSQMAPQSYGYPGYGTTGFALQRGLQFQAPSYGIGMPHSSNGSMGEGDLHGEAILPALDSGMHHHRHFGVSVSHPGHTIGLPSPANSVASPGPLPTSRVMASPQRKGNTSWPGREVKTETIWVQRPDSGNPGSSFATPYEGDLGNGGFDHARWGPS